MTNLWDEIIKNISPLKRKQRGNINTPKLTHKNIDKNIEVNFIDILEMKKCHPLPLYEKDLKISDTSRIDKTIEKQIKNNKKKPDSVLDLHGYTLQKAYDKFEQFIITNYQMKNRTLLLITGKGNPEKQTGTIRKEFPNWINTPSIKPLILYVELAPYKNKNDGAFYIYLRK